MREVEYDPTRALCADCNGQGKFEDAQGQWWLCRKCAGYGSPAARIYGEKHPENIKPASIERVDFDYSKSRSNTATKTVEYAVEWSDIAASPWGELLYSVEADKGFR